MAFGYVLGNNSVQVREKGDVDSPIYIDSTGRAQLCTSVNLNAASATKLFDDRTIGEHDTPVYFNEGKPVACDEINLNAASSSKLSISEAVGATDRPVYFKADGLPHECAQTLDANISGNSATVGGRTIASAIPSGYSTTPDVIWGSKSGDSNLYPYSPSHTSVNHATEAESCTGEAAKANTLKAFDSSAKMYVGGFLSTVTSGSYQAVYYNSSVYTSGSVLYNAAWSNDYSEYRFGKANPGVCVVESSDGVLRPSTKRLQRCPYVVSDTYGMVIGDPEDAIPVAVAGRVLAHTDKDVSAFSVGDAVCSGKYGTISKMNRLEVILFPDRILGYVSEIPSESKWHDVSIDNRIWIKIK